MKADERWARRQQNYYLASHDAAECAGQAAALAQGRAALEAARAATAASVRYRRDVDADVTLQAMAAMARQITASMEASVRRFDAALARIAASVAAGGPTVPPAGDRP